MKQRPRIYYTEEQKSLMWNRWQKGESLGSIAKLFDRHHSTVARIIGDYISTVASLTEINIAQIPAPVSVYLVFHEGKNAKVN